MNEIGRSDFLNFTDNSWTDIFEKNIRPYDLFGFYTWAKFDDDREDYCF